MIYDNTHIIKEILDTANGVGFHGNALYVSKDMHCMSPYYRHFLDTLMSKNRVDTEEEKKKLYDICDRIMKMGEFI